MGMTTRQYLGQLDRLDKTIQNKLSEIYQLKTMASNIGVVSDKERVQTSRKNDQLGETVAKIVDLENETDELVDELVDKRKHIVKQIEKMDNTIFYHVLFGRYVAKKDLKIIAEEIPCSYRQVARYHGQALLEFEQLYGDEYL